MKKTAVVIGSGVAGLATSIRLAQAGYKVVVFEVNAYPGGKITTVQGKGYRFDAGPSLFTMPELVTELFGLCGENPEEHFNYYKKEVACHYFWRDGTTLKAYTDSKAFAKEVANTFNIAEKYIANYLGDAADVYDATHHLFLESSLHRMGTYLQPEVFKAFRYLHKLHLLSTLHQVNKQKLEHPKLVQLFDRFATYNGSSPYKTPGVMSIIPHLEHNLGSFYPKGGMHSITTSLYSLAQRQGVQFNFEEKAERLLVEGNLISGVVTNKGHYSLDVVFSNMDVVPTYRKLMPRAKAPEKTLSQKRSSSALIFYWGIKHTFPQLDLHNIFFSEDYKAEFDAIFEHDTVSEDPTIYVNISSKEEKEDAPENCENWFVMVNVPANTGQDWTAITARLRQRVIEHLSERLQADIASLIEFEESLDPRSIEQKTGSYQGALYGAASNSTMAAFLRHPNFSRQYNNLYFCGGSVHPGGGVPLALLSAKIAAGLVKS